MPAIYGVKKVDGKWVNIYTKPTPAEEADFYRRVGGAKSLTILHGQRESTMSEKLVKVIGSAEAAREVLTLLLDPTPAMIRAMETIELDLGHPPSVVDVYQAAIWEALRPLAEAHPSPAHPSP